MATLNLPAVLDREGSRMTAMDIHDCVGRGEPLVLDGSGVERIGTAGLQLLLSALRPSDVGVGDVRIERPSPTLCAAAVTAGVAARLGLDIREDGHEA